MAITNCIHFVAFILCFEAHCRKSKGPQIIFQIRCITWATPPFDSQVTLRFELLHYPPTFWDEVDSGNFENQREQRSRFRKFWLANFGMQIRFHLRKQGNDHIKLGRCVYFFSVRHSRITLLGMPWPASALEGLVYRCCSSNWIHIPSQTIFLITSSSQIPPRLCSCSSFTFHKFVEQRSNVQLDSLWFN